MSQPAPSCFFDAATAQDSPLFLIGGTWLCQVHARCAGCRVPLIELLSPPVSCSFDDYGYLGHEESLFCSLPCMEEAHPEPPERDPEEED